MSCITGYSAVVVVASVLVGVSGGAGANVGAGFEPACSAHLSAAQAARFQLATAACTGRPAVRPTEPALQADALVATAVTQRPQDALPPRTAAPALQSAHLQMFSRAGGVATGYVEPAPAPRLRAQQPAPRRRALRLADTAALRAVPPLRAVQLSPAIDLVAQRHDIDPLLLHAIAHVESRHDPAALSHAGARGLMQVMPGTGRRFGVASAHTLHDASVNLEVSATYLKVLQRRFGGDLSLVLAAYNAGEGAVERHGRRIPQNGETPGYVRQVLARYRALGNAARSAVREAADTVRAVATGPH